MDFFDMITEAVKHGSHSLPPNRWDPVSIDGKKTAKVIAHDMGANLPSVWTYFTFQDNTGGAQHTIWGESNHTGAVTIFLVNGDHTAAKGNPRTHPRIAVQPIIAFPSMKVSVRFKFTGDTGQDTEYRFDGRSFP